MTNKVNTDAHCPRYTADCHFMVISVSTVCSTAVVFLLQTEVTPCYSLYWWKRHLFWPVGPPHPCPPSSGLIDRESFPNREEQYHTVLYTSQISRHLCGDLASRCGGTWVLLRSPQTPPFWSLPFRFHLRPHMFLIDMAHWQTREFVLVSRFEECLNSCPFCCLYCNNCARRKTTTGFLLHEMINSLDFNCTLMIFCHLLLFVPRQNCEFMNPQSITTIVFSFTRYF